MSGGGTNTTTSSNAPPQAFTDAYKGVVGQAQTVAGQPLQQYPGQIVAGLSPDQQRGITDTQSAAGIAAPYINSAAQHIDAATTPIWNNVPQFSAANVGQYQNPYTDSVVDATQRQFNNQNQIQQQGIIGDSISKGAFGGDRQAVASGITAGQQQLAQAPVIAGLRNQAYNQALQEFNQQQGAHISADEANAWLNSQAGAAMGSLGQEALGTSLTEANALLGVGGLEQTQAQANLNVPYQQFIQQQAYPFQTTGWLANIAEGLGGASGGTSSTSSPAPSVASQIGGAGAAGIGILGQTGAFGPNGYLTGSGGSAANGSTGISGGDNFYSDGGGGVSSYGQARGGGIVQHRAPGGGIDSFPAPGASSAQIPTGVPDVGMSVVPGADGMGSVPPSHGTMNILKDYGHTSTTSKSDNLGGLLSLAGGIVGGIYGGPVGSMAGSQLGNAVGSSINVARGGTVPFPGERARPPGTGRGIVSNDNWGWPDNKPVQRRAAGGYTVSVDPSTHGGPGVPMLSYAPGGGGITAGGGGNQTVSDYLASQMAAGLARPPAPPVAPQMQAPAPAAPVKPPEFDQSGNFIGIGMNPAALHGDSNGMETDSGAMRRGGIVARAPGGDIPGDGFESPTSVPIDPLDQALPLPPVPPRGGGIVSSPSAKMVDGPPPPPPPSAKEETNKETGRGIKRDEPTSSPWRTLTNIGFGIMGGTSPQAGVNIGRGALTGIELSDKEHQADLQQQLRRDQMETNAAYRQGLLGVRNRHEDSYGDLAAARVQRLQDLSANPKNWAPMGSPDAQGNVIYYNKNDPTQTVTGPAMGMKPGEAARVDETRRRGDQADQRIEISQQHQTWLEQNAVDQREATRAADLYNRSIETDPITGVKKPKMTLPEALATVRKTFPGGGGGGQQAPAAQAPVFTEGQTYVDGSGNKAVYRGGKFVPVP